MSSWSPLPLAAQETSISEPIKGFTHKTSMKKMLKTNFIILIMAKEFGVLEAELKDIAI
jgi:hypothetical protein